VAGSLVACLAIGLSTGMALAGSGAAIKTTISRGKGTTLIVSAASSKVIVSYGFRLKKSEKSYTITSAKLIKVNGKPETSAYYKQACTPAKYQSDGYALESATGDGIVCGASIGLPPNAKSLLVDVATNKCLPAGAIVGIKGPSGACRK
jgi:hypothetical protein